MGEYSTMLVGACSGPNSQWITPKCNVSLMGIFERLFYGRLNVYRSTRIKHFLMLLSFKQRAQYGQGMKHLCET